MRSHLMTFYFVAKITISELEEEGNITDTLLPFPLNKSLQAKPKLKFLVAAC